MNPPVGLSEEMLDFFKEMLNIGVGNAAGALEQLLGCRVEVLVPDVRILSAASAPLEVEQADEGVVGVKMQILGDIPGTLFFIIPERMRAIISRLLENTVPGLHQQLLPRDLTAFAEIANILAGVYLGSIHQFCRLNLFHSVPAVVKDMFQAVYDETMALINRGFQEALLVINEFSLEGVPTRIFMLIFFDSAARGTLAHAIQQAQALYGQA